MEKIVTKEVKFRDGIGKIHAIRTGTVSVKKGFKTARGGAALSKINFLFETDFTSPLPIWVWLIEHPEGIFLVDTGENAHVGDGGYFKNEGWIKNWINTTQFRFQVAPAEEIGPQLAQIGLSPEKIDTVVLTHLHLDHVDGLKYFEKSQIVVHDEEWAHPNFAVPSLYPRWFRPTLLSLHPSEQSPFSKSRALTKAGDLVLVATPGHTKGHCSVLAITEDHSCLLAGDVTYDEKQLTEGVFAGAHQNFALAGHTYRAIKQFCATNRSIYLPSHDPASADRLFNNRFFHV